VQQKGGILNVLHTVRESVFVISCCAIVRAVYLVILVAVIKLGYYDRQSATASNLFRDTDDAFFHKILYNEVHLLRIYLADRSQIVYTLCNRNHNKILIPKTSDLNERHFLIRVLYKRCY